MTWLRPGCDPVCGTGTRPMMRRVGCGMMMVALNRTADVYSRHLQHAPLHGSAQTAQSLHDDRTRRADPFPRKVRSTRDCPRNVSDSPVQICPVQVCSPTLPPRQQPHMHTCRTLTHGYVLFASCITTSLEEPGLTQGNSKCEARVSHVHSYIRTADCSFCISLLPFSISPSEVTLNR